VWNLSSAFVDGEQQKKRIIEAKEKTNNESRRARVKTRFSSVLYPGGKKNSNKAQLLFLYLAKKKKHNMRRKTTYRVCHTHTKKKFLNIRLTRASPNKMARALATRLVHVRPQSKNFTGPE